MQKNKKKKLEMIFQKYHKERQMIMKILINTLQMNIKD